MDIPEIFGEDTFSLSEMQKYLPEDVFEKLQQTIQEGKVLDLSIADSIANAMLEWALARGATHYAHWFQPLNDCTAEKHESFIIPIENGKIKMDFSGKMLIKGEADASSFPNGGMCTTATARGYTVWDCNSYAFIKNKTLFIPTVLFSYNSQVLDKKIPLLKSIDALNKQSLRILKLLGKECKRVITTVGAEQEYFLVDSDKFNARTDLAITGRTLFGTPLIKGQQLEKNYYGILPTRVAKLMAEIDEKLWRLGILAKTKHCEVAPCQFEIAPIFSVVNIAVDHNQLLMQTLQDLAAKHNFVCLLHEKPFQGLNGSGKHNNWSICTDTGENLLEPTDTPAQNMQFLLFLIAIIQAVDVYHNLLRIACASASNDQRLGGQEAPPAIISIFLGDNLTKVLQAVASGKLSKQSSKQTLNIGVDILPEIAKDSIDRNRTSPFAFTGNKFEFRMLGSSASIADTNTYLNTAVADVLKEYADRLESADNLQAEILVLLKEKIAKHSKILYNGDNYTAAWREEANKRGFFNLINTAEALEHFITEKNIALFARHSIFTEEELRAREKIFLEKYYHEVWIEAKIMLTIWNREIYPAVQRYLLQLSELVIKQKTLAVKMPNTEQKLLQITNRIENAIEIATELERLVKEGNLLQDRQKRANHCAKNILPQMEQLRKVVDTLEEQVDREYWPYPTYAEILNIF